MSMLFVCAFEFGPGPIVWIYLSEVCNDKSLTVATFCNWTAALCVGFFTPTLLNAINTGPTYLLFGGFNIVGVLFMAVFMKETMGLSDAEMKNLYRNDRDVIGEFERK